MKRKSILIYTLFIILLCTVTQSIFAKEKEDIIFTKNQLTTGLGVENGNLRIGLLRFGNKSFFRWRMSYERENVIAIKEGTWENNFDEGEEEVTLNSLKFSVGRDKTFFNKLTTYGFFDIGYNKLDVSYIDLGVSGGLEYHLNDKVSLYTEMKISSGDPMDSKYDEIKERNNIIFGLNYGFTTFRKKKETAKDTYVDDYDYKEVGLSQAEKNKIKSKEDIDINLLEKGMTKQEVLNIWGYPYNTEKHGEYSLWDYYKKTAMKQQFLNFKRITGPPHKYYGYTLYFKDDTLMEWSEYDYQRNWF